MQFLFHGLAASSRSNTELGKVFQRFVPADAHLAHVGAGRPNVAPAQHVFHIGSPTLEQRFDGAGVEVAHPAVQVATARLVRCRVAKANPLDAAEHAYVSARTLSLGQVVVRQRRRSVVPEPPPSSARCRRERE